MLRSSFAAALGAAFGALAIAPMRERVQDQLWQPVEACSVGLVALAAALIVLFVLAMRAPRSSAGKDDAAIRTQLHIAHARAKAVLTPSEWALVTGDYSKLHYHDVAHPTPPTGGSGVKPPARGQGGRFAKRA